MARLADHQGLALSFHHERRPRGLWPSRSVGEIGECTDLVNFHLGPLIAEFAPTRLQPIDQLFAAGCERDRRAVHQERPFAPFQRDAPEPDDQWLPACPFDGGFKADATPVWGVDDGLVLAGHLRHGRFMLRGQRLEHRGLDDPTQPVQSGDVPGQQVVLDDAPVLRSVGADDGGVIVVQQLGSARGIAALEVRGAFGPDHRRWYAQPR